MGEVGTGWPPPQFERENKRVVSDMEDDYFIERLRAQEDEIRSLRETFETARQRGNKKLMGISRKRLELALRLREIYQRMIKRDSVQSQA